MGLKIWVWTFSKVQKSIFPGSDFWWIKVFLPFLGLINVLIKSLPLFPGDDQSPSVSGLMDLEKGIPPARQPAQGVWGGVKQHSVGHANLEVGRLGTADRFHVYAIEIGLSCGYREGLRRVTFVPEQGQARYHLFDRPMSLSCSCFRKN